MFEQICAAIRSRAAAGELVEGTRLPPTRAFATELGVSRSTMVTAYEQLVAEGYLQSLPGSGYTVCPMGAVELTARPRPLDEHAAADEAMEPRPFQSGQPDMRLFPHAQWAKTVSRVCRTEPETMLVGGTLFGNPDLRKAVAHHVAEWRGIEASPRQIIITAGSSDALEICLRTLTEPGDTVGLEDPGYPPLRNFVSAMGLSPEMFGIDESGARVPGRGQAAKMVVLTPSHQFPLGGAMSPSRRLAFIRWAEAGNSWIVEDDYDSEFRYAGRPIPAMAGFDRLRRTIYVGSFSKIFSNSLRLGYVIVPDALVENFRATLMRFGVRASYMPQQALAAFIDSGEFYRHLRRMRRVYGDRRKFLLDRLATDFNRYGSFHDHQAGMQVAFHLSDDYPERAVVDGATEQGITTQGLSQFCSRNRSFNGLMLGFCGFAEEDMGAALTKLKRVLDEAGGEGG